MTPHITYMHSALKEAEKAADLGEIPVGAVAVRDGVIVGRGYNRKELDSDPMGHAEIIAMREASQTLGGWRLRGVTLYCTLEPCVMCAGAMVQARLPRLVWAADDLKAGAGGSIMNLLDHPGLNHRVEVIRGVLADEANAQLKDFFAALRESRKNTD